MSNVNLYNPLISVIVPIYNAETYLEECIESILNQEYSNIEILLINDGSTDNSYTLCKKYTSDNRIKLFDKLNGGVSSARNYGLNFAKGDYIVFVDSDDIIEKNYINKLVCSLDKADIILCGYKEFYKNKIINHSINNSNIVDKESIVNLILTNNNVCGFLVNKIYKSDIIKKYKIRLNENIHYCEDVLFNLEYLKYIESGLIISNSGYLYRMRKSSATKRNNTKKIDNLIKCFNLIQEIIEHNFESNISDFYYFKQSILMKNKKTSLNNNINSKISFKNKIKYYILSNFNFIYVFYMKFKAIRYKYFE